MMRLPIRELGATLRQLRLSQNMTQDEVVQSLQDQGIPCSTSALSRYEGGAEVPTKRLEALLDVFGATAELIITTASEAPDREATKMLEEIVGPMSPEELRARQDPVIAMVLARLETIERRLDGDESARPEGVSDSRAIR